MAFQLPKESRDYFRHLLRRSNDAARFDTFFDFYYLCLIVGLDRQAIAKDSDLESEKFVERYPSDYQNQADVIAGLLISAELCRKDIEKDNRSSIEKEILRLLDHQSSTRLSEEGMRLLNLYSAWGFKVIRERIVPPQTLEEFLALYHHDVWDSNVQSAT